MSESQELTTSPQARAAELAEVARMLDKVFGGKRYTPEYIDWQYERSPEGREVAVNLRHDDALSAHYALIPQTWTDGGADEKTRYPLMLSLNTAVTEAARGKGVFTRLAEETYQAAVDQRGAKAVLGVANANSTPGFTRRLGFAILSPLPVIIGVANPFGGRGIETHVTDAAFTRSPRLAEIAGSVAAPSAGALAQLWTAEKLAWRLSSPLGPYWLHADASGVLVSRVERHKGVPIVIALKFLPRRGQGPLRARALLDAACAHHKTPFFLYAGFNEAVQLSGLPLPRRLLPSPLNLIYRPLDPAMPPAEKVRLAAFEFLDFDAY
ncbi:GNAT superfamily N-acetyltransferase [Azospirillum sp. OGB3]|uniref:GNAT family N-acetyltransferase n=1 Tax=Azospirillum sp. OGB3 TaxID=2587012 RepID=UPI001606AD40|nr:GNAT family N-acetyltransferase [Azospirillum sp. OGB3]MBB3267952.1 GNAT superfamily N-acetyltransferase [Azospirillum sp. OGB3]